jgi:subtilisin family serine protease
MRRPRSTFAATTAFAAAVENLESRKLLAAVAEHVVAAGTLFSTADGAAAIRMNWKGQQVKAIEGAWIVQLDGYHGYLPDQQRLATPLVKRAGASFEMQHHLGASGLFLVHAPVSITVNETLQRFAKIPGFRYAEPDMLYEIQLTPNDASFSSMWGMNNTGQSGGTVDADIDAPEAWNISTGSSNVVVGMVDTGIDYNHPDLAANVWTNPFEIPGNNIDDEGNGYIDDVRGYDWWGNGSTQGTPDNDPMDQNNHGSHTAGTVGAVGNNGVGVTGVNWNVKMIALKIGGPGNSVSSSAAISGLNYCIDMKNRGVNIKLTSHSWGGGGFSSTLNTAIANQAAAGILLVAAAGNNGTNTDTTPFYPADYAQPNIISVGNMNRFNGRDSTSNFGLNSVDLFAPGTDVLSTVRVAAGSYANFTGTSMACPHVAGTAALCWAVNPNATYAQVRDAILQHTEPVAAFATLCVTGGRLSADDAVAALNNPVPAIPSVPDLDSGSDLGVFPNDNITRDNTPTFTGTAEAGSTVRIFANGVEVGSGVATGGNYSITTSALVDGVRPITATASNANGSSNPTAALNVTIDTLAPTAGSGAFQYATAPHSNSVSFNENVQLTVGLEDFTLENLTTSQFVSSLAMSGFYDVGTNTQSINYGGLPGGILTDGNYRLTALAAGITDVAGNPLAANYVFNFFHLTGDANHDSHVDLLDFNVLSLNFGQSSRNFTQGDFDYSGTVDLLDFNLLSARFGASLGPSVFSTASIGTPPAQHRQTDADLLLESLV